MRSAYRILAHLVAIGVVVQAATLAFGIFGLWNDVDAGLVVDDNYEWNTGMMLHGAIGMLVMPFLSLLLLIVSFFAKVPRGITLALIIFGTVILQIMLALVGFGIPAIGALHGVNAIVILALAIVASRRARATTATPADVTDVARV
jgi:hypothetical protein